MKLKGGDIDDSQDPRLKHSKQDFYPDVKNDIYVHIEYFSLVPHGLIRLVVSPLVHGFNRLSTLSQLVNMNIILRNKTTLVTLLKMELMLSNFPLK